ncbi:MAG: hypothetical protein IPH61_13565 [Bacteroidetes bacterium]|nr:hypothetical protein [Bacteroidota bacterium]MBK8487155.1 hypothetical protein [Bacteroidota bacterium]
MHKYLKYSLIGVGALLGLILLLIIAIPLLFENKIKAIFINELNKNLATEVVVNEKDIHLSMLRNWPQLALSFENIGIKESTPESDNFFIQAGELNLVFNIKDLINKKYNINKLVIKDAAIILSEDAQGNINYKFWKTDSNSTSSEFEIQLKEILLKNVDFKYLDDNNDINMFFTVQDLSATGNFYTEEFDVDTKGKIFSHFLIVSNETYLEEREVTLNCNLDVNLKEQLYAFSKSSVQINNNTFAVAGNFKISDGVTYDLQLDSKNVNIEALLITIPSKYRNSLNGLQSKGKLNFSASIKGPFNKRSIPLVTAKFDLEKSTINHEKFGDKLTDVKFSGYYSNGGGKKNTASELKLQNFTGKYKGEILSGYLHVINLSNPSIDCNLNGTLPASILLPAFLPGATDISGAIAFDQVKYKGDPNNISNANISRNPPSGNVHLKNVSCKYQNELMQFNSADIALQNQNLVINNLNCVLPGADISGEVTINNWLLLLAKNFNGNLLGVNGSIYSKQIDIYKLRNYFTQSSSTNISESNSTISKPVWMQMSGMLNVQFDEMKYKLIVLNNVKTNISCSGSIIAARNMTADIQNGNVQLAATFRYLNGGNYLLESSGILNNIDITELFRELENFGQTTLTDKNIKGKATVLVENFTIGFTPQFEVIEKSIYTLANVKIDNGQLINYSVLESLSKFVDIKELQDIKFETLQNQIEIKDRTIYIPATSIRSSAMDLYISGTHTFDNVIDYQLKLSMADVMMKKFFKGSKSSDDYEKAEGGINVYLVMKGTVEHPEINFNKKEGKKKLEQSGLDEPDFLDIFKPDQVEEKKKELKKESQKQATTPIDTIEYIDWEDE